MSDMGEPDTNEVDAVCDTIPREIRDKIDQATRGMSDYDLAMFARGYALGSQCAVEQMERTLRALWNARPDLIAGPALDPSTTNFAAYQGCRAAVEKMLELYYTNEPDESNEEKGAV